jgi:hypothetical protein
MVLNLCRLPTAAMAEVCCCLPSRIQPSWKFAQKLDELIQTLRAVEGGRHGKAEAQLAEGVLGMRFVINLTEGFLRLTLADAISDARLPSPWPSGFWPCWRIYHPHCDTRRGSTPRCAGLVVPVPEFRQT